MGRKRHPLIGIKPGSTSPAIAGTRIRVAHIVRIRREFETDEAAVRQALEEMPHITAEEAQAAIDYWRDKPDVIEAEMRAEDELWDAVEAGHLAERLIPPGR